jgi:FtsP/CotA-like multicopper oxidase with cupredoxin domain
MITLILAVTLPAGALAQIQNQVCAFTTAKPAVLPGDVPFVEPPVLASENGVLKVALDVAICEDEDGAEIYRHYRDTNSGKVLVPGPTWAVNPGDQIILTLNNTMPDTAPDEPTREPSARPSATYNGPHNFNVTNMHTHGLWVSPDGNSDNVLIRVNPGTTFTYEYQLPKEHWAGTMWYHPHNHGSTSVQVASGMAGALIIQGGLDDMPGMPAPEDDHVLVLQQIFGSKRANKLVGFSGAVEDAIDPAQVRTTINADWRPTLTLTENTVQRLRFINAASHDNQVLQIVAYDPANPEDRSTRLDLHAVAYDGIAAVGKVQKNDTIMLAPGNRVDLLVAFPEGVADRVYAIWSLDDNFGRNNVKHDELIGYIRVGSPAAASGDIPAVIPAKYGPVSHVIAENATIDVNRELLFSIQEKPGPEGGVDFHIDNHPFEAGVVNQMVYEGVTEQWTINNNSTSVHPFHIHVNPFKLTDVNTDALEGPTAPYSGFLPAYFSMRQGHYMDTLLVPPQVENKIGAFTMQSRFLRFIGTYVLHCHILGHEDAGMMQLVQVIPAPGAPGTADHH